MSDPVNLTALAHRINTAMAHDLPVTVGTSRGHTYTGMVTRKRIDPQRKIDPKRKDQSNLLVTIAGTEVPLESMQYVDFGS